MSTLWADEIHPFADRIHPSYKSYLVKLAPQFVPRVDVTQICNRSCTGQKGEEKRGRLVESRRKECLSRGERGEIHRKAELTRSARSVFTQSLTSDSHPPPLSLSLSFSSNFLCSERSIGHRRMKIERKRRAITSPFPPRWRAFLPATPIAAVFLYFPAFASPFPILPASFCHFDIGGQTAFEADRCDTPVISR